MADDDTHIRIELPLPMDVASTLLSAIGLLYPGGTVSTQSSHNLNLRIPKDARAKRVSRWRLLRAKVGRTSVLDDTNFDGFNDGWIHMSPPEELCLHLGNVAHQIFTQTEGAVNYVEWTIRTEEEDMYQMSIARSKEQTPGALLKKAQARIKELELQLLEVIDK